MNGQPSPQHCIYCPQTDPAKFRGREHVIAQSFGRFGAETPVLRCVCDDCNALFGRELDPILARETLEGVGRYNRGITSSGSRPQRRLRISIANKREMGAWAGVVLKGVDGRTGRLGPPAAQYHVWNRAAEKFDVFLLNEIEGRSFADETYGGSDVRRHKIFAETQQEEEGLLAALGAIGVSFRPSGQVLPPCGENGQPLSYADVEIEGELDILHKRALAKVLINFAAYKLGEAEVRKSEWNFVRRFVRYGEGLMKARLTAKPFWDGQETDEWRLADDSINIRLENRDGKVIGVLQFYNNPTYELVLIEGYALELEPAARFTNGQPPLEGFRGPVPSRA